MTNVEARSPLAARCHQLLWASYALLLGQQVLDALIYQAPWIIWLAKLLPLLMFLPGMRADRPRSFIWLCFISLLYFISLVERIFAEPGNLLTATGLAAVVVLFVSAMLYVRFTSRKM